MGVLDGFGEDFGRLFSEFSKILEGFCMNFGKVFD